MIITTWLSKKLVKEIDEFAIRYKMSRGKLLQTMLKHQLKNLWDLKNQPV